MKVLHINREYPYGSTGKIVSYIHTALLERGHESFVYYGRGPIIKEPHICKVSSEFEAKVHSAFSRLTGLDFAYSLFATRETISLIKKNSPDVVHLHCLNGHFINLYSVLHYLKANDIKTIITLHSEMYHTAGCEHAFDCDKWKYCCSECNSVKGILTKYFRDDAKCSYKLLQDSFKGFDNLIVVGVSEWLTNRAMQSAVFSNSKARFVTVNNGSNPSDFFPIVNKSQKSTKTILHVTPDFSNPNKGGHFIIELAKLCPDYNFEIIGKIDGSINLPDNVKAIGVISDSKVLNEYYNNADVTVLTSKRETFSMVCLESLLAGTPVVGFESGGPESVFGDYSIFVKYGDLKALKEAVDKALTNNNSNSQAIRDKFSSRKMAVEYISLYESLL